MTTRAAIWPSGTRVVWRSLNWGEYRKVRSFQGPPAERALELYKLTVTSGPAPDQLPAGIMMWMYQDEMENNPFSGTFRNLSRGLNQARLKVNSTYLISAQALIASVLRIPFEDMEKWDAETFLTRLAQAELISGSPFNPVDPEATDSGKASANQKGKTPKKPLTHANKRAIEKVQERAEHHTNRSKKTR